MGAIYIDGISPSNPLINLVFRYGSLTVSFYLLYFYHYFKRSENDTGFNIYTRSEVVFWFGQIAKEMFRNLEFIQNSMAFSTHQKVNIMCKML